MPGIAAALPQFSWLNSVFFIIKKVEQEVAAHNPVESEARMSATAAKLAADRALALRADQVPYFSPFAL